MSITSNPRLQVYQREDKTYRLTFKSRDQIDEDPDSATFNPQGLVNLTGFTVHYQWKKNVNDPDPPVIAKITPTEIVLEPQTALPWTPASTLGEAKVFLVPDDTDPTINPELKKLAEVKKETGTFFFDVWAVAPGGAQRISLRPTAIDLLETVNDF